MGRVVAGIALLVVGVVLAAFPREIGNYFIDEHDDFWGRSRWTSWLVYTDRDKRATRRLGIVAA